MKHKPQRLFTIFLFLSMLEGLVVSAVLLAIPGDPKNAFLFGYSKSRLLLLAAALVILAGLAVALLSGRLRAKLYLRLIESTLQETIILWTGGVAALLLWLTVFTPAARLGELGAGFTRLQPLLIWLELLVLQWALLGWFTRHPGSLKRAFTDLKEYRKLLLIGAALFALTTLVYLALAVVGGDFPGRQLYFPPGAPLSALSVLSVWVVFLLISIASRKFRAGGKWRRVVPALLFTGVWVLTFITWMSIPLACTDDRPGPYPPNFVCYPHVNDAVYSIGSHYITLGQGVNNHWLTDKPMYMAFLALGQAVAGQGIEDYLVFQVAVVALIPALLFIAGRKKFGSAFGLFLAALMALQGAYSIMLYRAVGSVNVKLENPELLTGLALIAFCFAVFKWLAAPGVLKWAILAGGSLGLASLLRFNPVFIAPLLLLVLLVANRKRLRLVVKPVLFFLLAFALVFSPWFLAATDQQGRNHYFAKIQEVISSRFGDSQGAVTLPETAQTQEPGVLTYNTGIIDKAGAEGMLLHFANNVYEGLAILPTNFTFLPLERQVRADIWDFSSAKPLWMKDLSRENTLALALNLALVLTGVLAAWKRFGLAGLSGVIIQAGYYLGNAVAQTSGGRYLEPVNWITIVYYSLGLLMLTRLLRRVFGGNTDRFETPGEEADVATATSSTRRTVPLLLAACLLVGLILPSLQLIPSTLPAEGDPAIAQQAFATLSIKGLVTEAQWAEFLASPNHVVVQGRAYHPRYYRGDFYRAGNLSFELMLLAKDHVYVGYSQGLQTRQTFSDGSSSIMLGCIVGTDALWSADRVIIESIAIIQLDHEEQLLVDADADWSCNP